MKKSPKKTPAKKVPVKNTLFIPHSPEYPEVTNNILELTIVMDRLLQGNYADTIKSITETA